MSFAASFTQGAKPKHRSAMQESTGNTGKKKKQIKGFITRNNTSAETETSRKHTYIILTPLNPTFI